MNGHINPVISPIDEPVDRAEKLWHVTVLSNFARGYDKYSRTYSKTRIPESSFPDRFYLLESSELSIGLKKAGSLLARLNLPGNRLLALETSVLTSSLRPNLETGLGRFVENEAVLIDGLAIVETEDTGIRLESISTEEAYAQSLQLLHPKLQRYDQLRPRSLSSLPIARGCQAACPFCFSDASASAEQDQASLDLERITKIATLAANRGAERFVITGGGEPGLVRHRDLCSLIKTGHQILGKTVLITNAHHLGELQDDSMADAFVDYAQSGLGVLAISRHHDDDETCTRLMNLDTDVSRIARIWKSGKSRWPSLKLRFTCVLQKGYVEDLKSLENYVIWAAELGVGEICFKELYVSTSVESVYHRHSANSWSYDNQVPLKLVREFADKFDFTETDNLPWGSPVYSGEWFEHPMKIAAYTEPSLFWERTKGLARSWNIMSDGRCLVSLEDRSSEILGQVTP